MSLIIVKSVEPRTFGQTILLYKNVSLLTSASVQPHNLCNNFHYSQQSSQFVRHVYIQISVAILLEFFKWFNLLSIILMVQLNAGWTQRNYFFCIAFFLCSLIYSFNHLSIHLCKVFGVFPYPSFAVHQGSIFNNRIGVEN